ncbi:MAG: fumarate hydratase [Chrysiogenetes bacterium]|nr:fumarate hydratase [Chrysiogenetes bacterium]
MAVIKQDDLIESVARALQFISYYHPTDFIEAVKEAYEREESEAARNAMAQILVNSRMSAMGHRPICQDTGIVACFVKIGMDAKFDSSLTVQEMVDEGVRRAYKDEMNPLRFSIVSDPAGARINTKDNSPAVVHIEMVPGDKVDVTLAAKGGGSENKSKFTVLNPNQSVADWVIEMLPKMGAGWCPPGMLGIGIGGTADKAMVMAKESLMEPVDIHELKERGAKTTAEKLRLEIYERANALGIGAQGLGGLTTVLDVKIMEYPTHAASLPVALIPNCAATRHIHFQLDGSGAAEFTPPDLSIWPDLGEGFSTGAKRVNIDGISDEEMRSWKAGDTLLISGKMLTGRDAAHKRLKGLLDKGEPLPEGVDFRGRFIYYVGPVRAVGDEAVGPAGPTTATRMDSYTDMMLDKTGLMGMIGKAERGPETVESIRKHKSCYLIAVGGAAYLVSKAIRSSRLVAFEDLGMEAIYEFEVQDMPVTVAVDSEGNSVHVTGPQMWQKKIAEGAGK